MHPDRWTVWVAGPDPGCCSGRVANERLKENILMGRGMVHGPFSGLMERRSRKDPIVQGLGMEDGDGIMKAERCIAMNGTGKEEKKGSLWSFP